MHSNRLRLLRPADVAPQPAVELTPLEVANAIAGAKQVYEITKAVHTHSGTSQPMPAFREILAHCLTLAKQRKQQPRPRHTSN